MIQDLPKSYSYDQFGTLHQVEHDHFNYTVKYRQQQSTNIEMSYLRLGWVSAHLGYNYMKKANAVDIGCGSGMFVKCCQGKFMRMVGYDVVGDSISREELYETEWDVVVLSDVLEHFEDINDLFKMKWTYAMISYPETPRVKTFDELKKWRHFKPNEHLHYFTWESMERWLDHNNRGVRAYSMFEDFLRKRWDVNATNISTVLVS